MSYNRLVTYVKEHAEPHELQQLYDGLTVIHVTAWARANQVWNFVTPEQWANYEKLHITNLTEQGALKDALNNLRNIFSERFKKWLEKARSKSRSVKKQHDKQSMPTSTNT